MNSQERATYIERDLRDKFWYSLYETHYLTPINIAIFYDMIELSRALKHPLDFDYPIIAAMKRLSFKNHTQFKKHIKKLANNGFINIISESVNQHQAMVVSFVRPTKVPNRNIIENNDNLLDKLFGK